MYLDGVRESLPDTRNVVHEIRMIDKRFVPEVSVVVVGTTLAFPNEDHVYHNPFSSSPAATFDLGAYKGGKTATVVADRTGEIEVHCNVHEDAAAKVFVLDTRFYAMTESDGSFSIDHVPPGTYRWVARSPWGESADGIVTVRRGGAARLDLTLDVRHRDRHRRKDGTAYY